jgi:hypothetical protein
VLHRTRHLLVRQPNYIVFYLPLPDGIYVVRILNGHLDITPRTWTSSCGSCAIGI